MRNRISAPSRVGLWLMCAFLLALGAGDVMADSAPADFAGTFSSAQITVQLVASNGGYAGTITHNGTSFPAKAAASGNNLSGTFTSSGHDFPFTASLQDNQLTFASGGRTYTLNRTVANPLAAPIAAPSNPVAASAAAPSAAQSQPEATAAQPNDDVDKSKLQMAGDFTVLGTTANGQTLFVDLPMAQTIEAAITQTADAMGKVLDAKPDVTGAYASAQAKSRGMAGFTGKLKAKDVRGLIFCGVGVATKGYTSTVILTSADASKSEIATLFGFLPVEMKMQTHKFPDSSGSIDLPDGWTTPGESACYGIYVNGPAGQSIVISSCRTIYDPNCLQVRQANHLYQLQMQNYQFAVNRYQQMLQMHQSWPNTPMPAISPPQKPVPPDPNPNVQFKDMVFCRYCDGVEDVLKYLYPITEDKARRAGNGYTSVDKVIAVMPAEGNPSVAGSKGGVAYLAVTDHVDGKDTPMRAINRFTTSPMMKGEIWQLDVTSLRAPEATFERDLPVMYAILNSVSVNMDVVNKKIADDGAKIRAIGAEQERLLLQRGREFQQQQDEHFQHFEAQMAAQSQARHDSASDFIEYIRGVRDIYDTQTGTMGQGDLSNINGIVNGMNAAANDPNRFVQIPLRYER